MPLGACTVEWTTPIPWILGSSENGSRLYIDFKCCDGKIINILKTHRSTKPNNYIYKTNFKNNLHILEDGASVVQVGGIEQVIVKILFKI